MGIKINTKISSIFLICTLLSINAVNAATFQPFVPSATMQIARGVEVREAAQNPKSEIVRVGIGTTGFSSYDYKEIVVYGTEDIQIYNDNLLVSQFPAKADVKIVYDSGMYVIYDADGSIFDKVAGPVSIICENGLLGVSGLKRAGKQALYRGKFELTKKNDKVFNLVNVIEVEDYLKGVVPNEMPVRFGLEALKAQSVAARNYVLTPRVKSSVNYDVVDSVASQVYFGANTETSLSDDAVEQTTGIVALSGWDLILALYSSTAGGYSESYSYAFSDPKTKEFPSEGKSYLVARPDMLSQNPLNNEEAASAFYKSVPDSYDIRSPYYRWTREWDIEELRKVLENTLAIQSATGYVKPAFKKGDKLGEILALNVKRRGESGKIVELDVVTASGTYKVFKELVIRRLLTKDGKSMPSANMVFEPQFDEENNLQGIKAYGGGFGHGVGMSQYGAGFMGSELKLPYEKILQHYYSGITLGTKPIIISADETQRSVAQKFYVSDRHAEIVVDNKFQVQKLITEINGKEYVFDLCQSLLPLNRICRIDISKYLKKGINTIVFSYPLEEGDRKGLRLFVELVQSEKSEKIW